MFQPLPADKSVREAARTHEAVVGGGISSPVKVTFEICFQSPFFLFLSVRDKQMTFVSLLRITLFKVSALGIPLGRLS